MHVHSLPPQGFPAWINDQRPYSARMMAWLSSLVEKTKTFSSPEFLKQPGLATAAGFPRYVSKKNTESKAWKQKKSLWCEIGTLRCQKRQKKPNSSSVPRQILVAFVFFPKATIKNGVKSAQLSQSSSFKISNKSRKTVPYSTQVARVNTQDVAMLSRLEASFYKVTWQPKNVRRVMKFFVASNGPKFTPPKFNSKPLGKGDLPNRIIFQATIKPMSTMLCLLHFGSWFDTPKQNLHETISSIQRQREDQLLDGFFGAAFRGKGGKLTRLEWTVALLGFPGSSMSVLGVKKKFKQLSCSFIFMIHL